MTFASAKLRSFLPAATFAMGSEFLMGVSGLVVAGNILGESALASMNLMLPVLNVVEFLTAMVATGASVMFATAIGGFQERRAHEVFTQGLFTAVGLGVVLMLVLAGVLGPFLRAFGASESVTRGALVYGTWFLPCVILTPVACYLVTLAYTDGDRRVYVGSYVAQLVGNFLLAVPLTMKFGLAGCAMAMSLGNLFAIGVALSHFWRTGNNLHFVRCFSLKDAWRICWCAVGDASHKLCNAILFALLNAYVVCSFGSEALAVLAVVLTVFAATEVFDGVGLAMQPLVGVYFGEGNDRRTLDVMNESLLVALDEGLLMSVVLLALPGLVIRFVGIADPALVPAAKTAVRLVALGIVGHALMMLFNSYYTVIEREKLAATITVMTMLLVPVPLIPLMGHFLGVNGVWLALGLAPIFAVTLFGIGLVIRYGRARFPSLLDVTRSANIHVFDLVLEPAAICAASAAVADRLKACGREAQAGKAALLVEEALMIVRDRNAERKIRAEVTADLNDGLSLVLRDDGKIFDITDADAEVMSLRSYLVSNLMTAIPNRRNLTTTGFNRNVFRL